MFTEPPPVVLLTGASTGLGLAVARALLARREYRVVLTARASSLSRFDEVGIFPSDNVLILPLDVSSAAERRQAVEMVTHRWGGVDFLINNAAMAVRTVIENIDDATWNNVMEVNCAAPMELARLVLPGMRKRCRGHIINISSVGGMMAMPTMSLYSATKFALEGASESLWYEVRPWKIHVSLVEPGFIHSDSFKRTRYTSESAAEAGDSAAPYFEHYRQMADFIERQMDWARAKPEDVAAVVLAIMKKKEPPLRVPATWDARLFSSLRRWLPRGIYHRLLYRYLPEIRRWGPQPADGAVPAGFRVGTRRALR